MPTFNYSTREVTAKVVYYGPGISGKTTSVKYLHTRIGSNHRSKLVSLNTETERTLFFDFFPIEFGQIGPYKIKFNFFTVPGQVFYAATRKLLLKETDGVVFVADSNPDLMAQNLESLEDLRENLGIYGLDLETLPFVIQYNKRDLPNPMGVDEMRAALNRWGAPEFETVATTGAGVMEAMKAVCALVLEEYRKKQAELGAARPGPADGFGHPGAHRVIPSTAEGLAAFGAGEGAQAPLDGAERTFQVPLGAQPGDARLTLTLPLDVQNEALEEGAALAVTVRVQRVNGTGKVAMHDLTWEPPARKGFWARLFGWI